MATTAYRPAMGARRRSEGAQAAFFSAARVDELRQQLQLAMQDEQRAQTAVNNAQRYAHIGDQRYDRAVRADESRRAQQYRDNAYAGLARAQRALSDATARRQQLESSVHRAAQRAAPLTLPSNSSTESSDASSSTAPSPAAPTRPSRPTTTRAPVFPGVSSAASSRSGRCGPSDGRCPVGQCCSNMGFCGAQYCAAAHMRHPDNRWHGLGTGYERLGEGNGDEGAQSAQYSNGVTARANRANELCPDAVRRIYETPRGAPGV